MTFELSAHLIGGQVPRCNNAILGACEEAVVVVAQAQNAAIVEAELLLRRVVVQRDGCLRVPGGQPHWPGIG